MMKQKFPSQKYKNLSYIPGKDTWFDDLLLPEQEDVFVFSLDGQVTQNAEYMQNAATFLDDVENYYQKALHYMREAIVDKTHAGHGVMAVFLDLFINYYLQQWDTDELQEVFGVAKPQDLDRTLAVAYFVISEVITYVDAKPGGQGLVFVMDLAFAPELTDEVLVVYFDEQHNIMELEYEE